MKSAVKMKDPLQMRANNDENWRKNVPSPSQFQLAEESVVLLERLKITSKCLEADLTPTLHLVIPELWNLRDHFKKVSRKGCNNIKVYCCNKY